MQGCSHEGTNSRATGTVVVPAAVGAMLHSRPHVAREGKSDSEKIQVLLHANGPALNVIGLPVSTTNLLLFSPFQALFTRDFCGASLFRDVCTKNRRPNDHKT